MKFNRIFSFFLIVFVMGMCFVFPVIYALDTTPETVKPQNSKITENLLNAFDKIDADATATVFMWTKDIDFVEASKELALESIDMSKEEWEEYLEGDTDINVIQEYIMEKRNASAELYTKYNTAISNKVLKSDEVVYVSKFSPVILAELNYARTVEIAKCNDVELMDYYSDTFFDDNTNSTYDITQENTVPVTIDEINQITQVDDVHDQSVFGYGYNGAGVKIGVLETSLPNASYFSNYDIREVIGTFNANQDSHANSVMQILTSVAPQSSYYIATIGSAYLPDIEELLLLGVNIINVSTSWGPKETYNTNGPFAQWLDHIAYSHDVHYVAASGNYYSSTSTSDSTNEGRGVPDSSMASNIITVGNLDVKGTINLADDIICYDSSYYNDIGEVNKPDLVAPGCLIETEYLTDYGTSFSAPQVSGAIALLCQQRSSLLVKQDVVKAILTAAVSFASPHAYVPDDLNYRPYGAGLLDCVGACWVNNHNRFVQSSIPSTTDSHYYNFTVSASDTRIRVSLTYLRKSTPNSTVHPDADDVTAAGLADLNLEVYAPGSSVPIAVSQTLNNNVEIVDFVPPITGTYTIRIVNNCMSYSPTYYAVAWI